MKTTVKFLTYVMMAFALVLTTASCEGEDGMDGEIGLQGPAGQDGTDGQDGEDGNANVIASPWIAQEFPTAATTFASFDILDTQITQEVADNAAVYAYGKTGNSTISIPFTFRNKTHYFAIFPDTNQFRFIAASVDGTPEVFNDISEVRYVIIPASASSGKSAIDYTDYEAVKRAYNLKD